MPFNKTLAVGKGFVFMGVFIFLLRGTLKICDFTGQSGHFREIFW
jgi:hypothetical protein